MQVNTETEIAKRLNGDMRYLQAKISILVPECWQKTPESNCLGAQSGFQPGTLPPTPGTASRIFTLIDIYIFCVFNAIVVRIFSQQSSYLNGYVTERYAPETGFDWCKTMRPHTMALLLCVS